MAKPLSMEVDEELKNKKNIFLDKLESDLQFNAVYAGDLVSFEWLDEIEKACPYIDIVVRKPKLILVKEESVVKIEKSKKITVDSVKDLAKHTSNISKYDESTNNVQPSKILDIRNEETYNIYENRFLYTLINMLDKFLYQKEQLLKNFEISDNKLLEYASNTVTDTEKVNIQLKISSESLPSDKMDKKIEKQLNLIRFRIKRVRDYVSSWQRSEMVKELEKAHVRLINPPIKKTNIILKNANFQIAVKLWDYLFKYDYMDNENETDNFQSDVNENLKGFLDHSFLIDYFVLDSFSPTKREQKEKLRRYAVLMITEELRRTLSLLLNCGIEITDEELLELISKELKREKGNRLIGVDDVKKKFKNAIDEYLERTQDYL